MIEVYADGGRWCATKRIDSDDPFTAMRFTFTRKRCDRLLPKVVTTRSRAIVYCNLEFCKITINAVFAVDKANAKRLYEQPRKRFRNA